MTVSLLAGNVYEYEFRFPGAEFVREKDHFKLEIPGCMQHGSEAEPLLPKYPLMLLLPPGETLESAELIVRETEELPLMLPLLPKQPDRPYSEGALGEFRKDTAVYRQAIYPVPELRTAVLRYRGANIVSGQISPLRYFPASGSATQIRSATLQICTKAAPESLHLKKRDRDLLAALLQNPETLSAYSINEDETEHLLIITSNDFAAEFDTLMDFYTRWGIRPELLTLDDIELEGFQGRDMQEKIRNSIWNRYLEKGLDYVLLGGTSSIVPHRGLSCSVNSGGTIYSSDNIPADLYYAALDGDWDANGNGIFGEYSDSSGFDEADLLPELAVGRMPAANISELQNLIAKSMRYQGEPVVDDLDKQIFFGEFLYNDPESWGADYLELLIGERSDNGYTTQGIPPHIRVTKWYDKDSTDMWSRETVVYELKKGQSFLHHDGHADIDYLMKFNTRDIDVYDFAIVNGVDNINPLIYTHGCNCGAFDYPNCIGARLVNDPGIAVGGVFNSRYGWFNEGSTEGPSIHLHREFMNALYNLDVHALGWAHTVSRIATAPWVTAANQHEQNALRWTFYTLNILGDPLMRIYRDTPRQASFSVDFSDISAGRLAFALSDAGTPLEGAALTLLTDEGEILAHGKSDAAGLVQMQLPDVPQEGDLLRCHFRSGDHLPLDTLIEIQSSGTEIIPLDFTLEAYPNPFNPETRLHFTQPQNADLLLQIVDLRGRHVETLIEGYRDSGSYEQLFRAAHLPSGLYFAVLKSGEKQMTKKLLLIR
ncbi:MAG: C25 family cysteine peptidase [Candidatus Neomarinimicrobiota bacterium]|nr:C25 family cysteine peptidase [bacterium]